MKKLLCIAMLLVATNFFAQEKSRVQKINGIEVYLLAEPAREYEALSSKGKSIQWGSSITGGLINESISKRVTKYVKRLTKEFSKQGVKFDAIVYTNGKQMTAIKFTEESTPENNRIAIVKKINGIPFYVMSEPLKSYNFIKAIGGGVKWKSAITAGLINNSIEQDLMKFAKKMKKKFRKKQISAIIYERGKKANAIRYN